VFDPQGVHVVSHAPEACTACDLFRKVRGFIVLLDAAVRIQAGVVFTPAGTVVTNAQVVGKARSVEVISDQHESWVGTVAARDVDLDLAVVTLPSTGRTWAPPDVHSGPPPPVGTDVFLIGHPVGLGWCVTRGIITGTKRMHGVSMIQTDAAFLPGNSGGALVDANGRLLGIVSAMHGEEGDRETALARPTAAALAYLENLESYAR
jgi:S1-C subfamily serine protease